VSKPGFASTETAFSAGLRELAFSLDPEGSIPTGMVRVPEGSFFLNITEIGVIGLIQLESFYIDKFGVTNRRSAST
jgi:hypothetical protein